MKREDTIQGVMIKVYHTDNGIFNISKFMDDTLKNQQKIRFSGARTTHQNGVAERTINMAVTTESAILMQAGMICHKEKLSTDLANRNVLCCMGL